MIKSTKYPVELRLKALARMEAGETGRDIERELGLSNGILWSWKKQKEQGRLTVPAAAVATVNNSGEVPKRYTVSPGGQKKYTEEFKQYVRDRVVKGEKPAAIARELNVSDPTLYGTILGRGKKAKSSSGQTPVLIQTPVQNILNYCPHCGLPLKAFVAAAATAAAADKH